MGKHLRHLIEPISSGSVNSEVANYHIITYDDENEGINYYKKQYITATYNITAVGEYGIVGNRTNGSYFDISMAPYMSVDGGEKIPTTYSYTFDTVGEHTIKFYMVALDKSLYRMFDFYDCAKGNVPQLVKIDWSRYFNPNTINTSRVMFQSCQALTSVGDLSKWNTSNVTDMAYMFNKCYKLTSVGDLSNWNTSNIEDLSTIFQNCQIITSFGDLSNWNVSNVTDMSYMFNKCYKLTSVGDLSNWNTSNVSNMACMFNHCESLTSLGDLSGWDTSNVTNMSWMFLMQYGSNGYKTALEYIGDLSNWNVSNVSNMYKLFCGCHRLLLIGDLSNWNVSNVTSMCSMFEYCMKITSIGDLSNWDVSNVTDMSYMFDHCESLTSLGDLSGWDTSNVTTMSWMFNTCNKLNPVTMKQFENWDISNVTTIEGMFLAYGYLYNDGSGKTGDSRPAINDTFTANWTLNEKVTSMRRLFHASGNFKEYDLSKLDFTHITSMVEMFCRDAGTQIIRFGKNLREDIVLTNMFVYSWGVTDIYFDAENTETACKRIGEQTMTNVYVKIHIGDKSYQRTSSGWDEIN